MTPKERINLKLQGKDTDKIIFCPAIYEHKAKLINESISRVSQNPSLLEQALLAEYEIYKPEMLTVGIDVYNIEAQALGCEISYPEPSDAVPSVSKRVLDDITDISKLKNTEMATAGRIPLILEAAAAVNKKIGNEVYIRGALSGPYSVAAELLGIEKIITALIMNPDEVQALLKFCTKIVCDYGNEFIKRGIEVCIFDSQASPPLVSPQLYKDAILPHVQKLVTTLKNNGAKFIEYVAGGDTGKVSESFFATGADIILSDFNSDMDLFLQNSKNTSALIRRNISPILIEQGLDEKLLEQVTQTKNLAIKNKNVITGTGVISYNVNPENILKIKEIISAS